MSFRTRLQTDSSKYGYLGLWFGPFLAFVAWHYWQFLRDKSTWPRIQKGFDERKSFLSLWSEDFRYGAKTVCILQLNGNYYLKPLNNFSNYISIFRGRAMNGRKCLEHESVIVEIRSCTFIWCMTSEATNSYVTSTNLMLFIDLFNEKK